MSHFPSAEDYVAEPIRFPPLTVIDVVAEAAAVAADYRNQVLSRVNTSCLRLAVMSGEYPWHRHPDSDELFLVVEGRLEIDLAGGPTLCLDPWQCVVVPAGTVHRTRAKARTVNLCFEHVGAATVFESAT
jgi:mannose-6-phosphate isomerase-like protein (cupin superfamily)